MFCFRNTAEEKDGPIYDNALTYYLTELVKEGKIQKSEDGKYFSFERFPSRFLSIRSIGDSFVIIDSGKNNVIGEIDYPRVLNECHPNAIYLHSGSQYEVMELDLTAKKVRVKQADIDYYTEPRSMEEIEILDTFKQKKQGEITVKIGRVRVTERVIGYIRKRYIIR